MEPIRKVVVLGGGSAGWLCALTLKRKLPELEVQVLRSTKVPVIGVGESTTPALPNFLHKELGLEQAAFYREVRPSWKLGIRLEWGDSSASHFNYPFDRPMDLQLPGLSKVKAYFCREDLTDLSHSSAMMDRGLAPVVISQEGKYVVMDHHAYHLENAPFLAYLERRCLETDVKLVEGDVMEVRQTESGDIQELQLEDGRSIAADLFLDCSGFGSFLLGGALGETFRSYDDSLFCDSAVIGSWPRDDEVRPYTTAETMEHGWCWRIDYLDHVTRGYVFSSQFCSPEDAMVEMRRKNPELGEDLRLLHFRTGRYENAWTKNVVAIGNAAGFIEPLEATALQLIVEQIRAVCRVLRDSDLRIFPLMRQVENERFRRLWDDVRDFLAVHYKFNRKLDSPFWQYCRQHCQLHDAQPLVDYYQQSGPSPMCGVLTHPYGIFGYDGYMTMLIGQRVPTAYEFEPSDEERRIWRTHLERTRRDIQQALPVREALIKVYASV